MKNKIIKRMFIFFYATILLIGSSNINAFATENSVTFTDRYQVLEIKDNKDLFDNMKELLPGGSATSTISLKNNSSRVVTFYLYATVDENASTVEGKKYVADLIKKIELTVKKNDTEIIYQGPASGNPLDATNQQGTINSMVLDASNGIYGINLGSVSSNDHMKLTTEIKIPGAELDNKYQDSYGLVNWVFCCEGTDIPVTPPTLEPSLIPTTIPTTVPTIGPTTEPIISPTIKPTVKPSVVPSIEPTESVKPPSESEEPIDIEDDIEDSEEIEVEVDDSIDTDGKGLAKTGFEVLYYKEVGILLLVLLLGIFLIEKVKRKKI